MRSTLGRLADLVGDMPIERYSQEAARMAVMDLVTAAAAAPFRRVAEALRTSHGGGPASVWFSGERTAPVVAAFANSLSAAAIDLDDGHRASRGHPGCAVIPAVFAEADRLDSLGGEANDRKILHAIVVGYEVGVRIASSRSFYARTGYWGSYGAAAGVAALRGVAPGVMAHALAIAGETSPHMLTTTAGPSWPQPTGSDVKEGIPWSVTNGIVAVGLAEAGLSGPLDMLDHGPFFDGEAILAKRQTLSIHETYTKFYSCCRHLHAPIDALLAVTVAHGISAEEIEAIDVEGYSGALRISNRTEPTNLVDMQYSIPYCLGLVALHGPQVVMPLTEVSLHDAGAAALAGRVRLRICDDLERRFPSETPVRVAVIARGKRFESEVTTPRGEAGDPLSWEDRVGKFGHATRFSLADDERDAFLSAFGSLALGDLTPLRLCLATQTRAGKCASGHITRGAVT